MPHRSALIAGLTCAGVLTTNISVALDERVARWTLATQAGTATLALVPAPGAPPVIMFVCGARFPGTAQVIISNLDPQLTENRLRIDISAGQASAMTLAERSPGLNSEQPAVLGEITVDQINALMRSRSFVLSWRIDAANSFQRPHTVVPLPNELSRHRSEFLRFCA